MAKTLTDAHGSPGAATLLVPRTSLIVSLECGRPLAGSMRILLDGAVRVAVGRGARRQIERTGPAGHADLTLLVGDSRMSGLHATFTRTGDQWSLEDRGSKNGSFLAGAPLTRAVLSDGDVIRLGQTFFVFHQGWPTDPGAPEVVEAEGNAPALTTLVPTLARHFEEIARVAATPLPVLLLGETGTGKEVMARAIHALSRRRGPFVAVNCSSLPQNLVESALFGHKRGAFSGAIADHDGLFRSAEGGTILLDEIGDLPLAAQGALLRVLQEAEVTPVGATRPVKVDARVIAATHRDVDALVQAGTFREDVLARLGGFTARLPPLSARRDDLGIVVAAVLGGVPAATPITLTSAAGAALFNYAWPRNIRELEKCLLRGVALAGSEPIDVVHLDLPGPGASPGREPARAAARASVPLTEGTSEEQRARLVEALRAHRGSVKAVADAFQTSRSQIHRWLKRFELSPDDFRT